MSQINSFTQQTHFLIKQKPNTTAVKCLYKTRMTLSVIQSSPQFMLYGPCLYYMLRKE